MNICPRENKLQWSNDTILSIIRQWSIREQCHGKQWYIHHTLVPCGSELTCFTFFVYLRTHTGRIQVWFSGTRGPWKMPIRMYSGSPLFDSSQWTESFESIHYDLFSRWQANLAVMINESFTQLISSRTNKSDCPLFKCVYRSTKTSL